MTRILALDLSLCNSGVARLRGVSAGEALWDVETVTVPPRLVPGKRPNTTKQEARQGADRLAWWRDWLVEEIADGIGLVAVEMLARHAPGACEMAKVRGVLEVACLDRGVPLVEVGIQAIKKHATGMTKADKQRMIDMARERFGGQVVTEHEADAVWIGDYARRVLLGEA